MTDANLSISYPDDDMIILIPARMAASRLPNKPMRQIVDKPLIEHVWEVARKSKIAPVYVATDHEDIYNHITAIGGNAVMTKKSHPSGSDRIYEAISKIDPDGKYQKLINLQGDLPTITTSAIEKLAQLLNQQRCELATLVSRASEDEVTKPQVVKAVMSWHEDNTTGRAHYFSREAVPHNATDYWHHIGLYGWQRSALEKFISLPVSSLEKCEKLEQLRAIEAGMLVEAAKIDEAIPGVDTLQDLIEVTTYMKIQSQMNNK